MTDFIHPQDEANRMRLAAAEDAVADLRGQVLDRDRRIAHLEARIAESERQRQTAVDMWREAMRPMGLDAAGVFASKVRPLVEQEAARRCRNCETRRCGICDWADARPCSCESVPDKTDAKCPRHGKAGAA